MKNKIQTIIIILTFPILGFCQNKFSFGANANSQFSFMTIKYSQYTSEYEESVNLGTGYSLGLQTQYMFSQKLFCRSGLLFQQNKIRHVIDNIRWPDETSYIQNNITMTTLVIPFDVGFFIKSKKEDLNYIIGFGGFINMNLKNNTTAKIIYRNSDTKKLEGAENDVDPSIYSLGIFGGFEKRISENLILGIEPNLRFTPNQFTLYLFDSEARTVLETGLAIRIRMN